MHGGTRLTWEWMLFFICFGAGGAGLTAWYWWLNRTIEDIDDEKE